MREIEKNGVHTISLYVANKPGVLVRVALVFSRRGYNIESLVVSPAKEDGYARMTITCSGDEDVFEQIIKQLAKLIDVVRAEDHTAQDMVETEVALVKIAVPRDDRTPLLQIAEHYKAKVVDFGADSLLLRAYGESRKLDSMMKLLSSFDVREVVRSGKIVMARGTALT
ncbi:MAG: acetolactate synthase small subunit [Pseudomonadota bacterium]|jgi:acetolactate synthase-1/3 small subunit